MTLSLRTRLTLWSTFAVVAALCLFGADVLWMQSRLGVRRVDRELDGLEVTIANVLRGELKEHATPKAAAEEARDTLAAPGRAIVILDSQDVPLATSVPEGVAFRDFSSAPYLPSQTSWTARTARGDWRVHIRAQTIESTTVTAIVGIPLTDVAREQHEVQEAMFVGIPIALIVAAAGGLWLASLGLRPITEALKTQRQFMADASHELRTPVSVVRTASEVTLSRDHRDEAEYREALAITGGQAKRLGRLVEDMLVLARADAGGYPLRPVDLYLDELVEECRRAAEVLARERDVTIASSAPRETPFRGDEDLLRQLVLNILQNAVQHTPPGGSVSIRMREEPGAIRISVTDTGAGIAPEDQKRIFDRFVRLDPSRRGNGTGLGLPIAKWIAESHGGTLVLETSAPGGSTFCVSLPRSNA
jgi:signal transduction histidine kinase